MRLYQCEHGIGDKVLGLGLGLPAQVVAITFTEVAVLYEVAFDNGGAHSVLACSDVKAPASK